MSASREKKKRQNQPEATAVETSKKGMGKALKRALIIVVAIVLVAAIVFLSLVSTGFFQKHSTAAVVNGHKLTPAMLNYYYVTAYNEISSYLGSALDTETPLGEQEFSGDTHETWEDYFLDYAASNAASTYAIYDEAMANGYTLSEDGQATIESELQMIDLYAGMYGLTDGNALLASQYGTGCNKSNYEDYLTVSIIASEYATYINESFTYTDADIDAYYAENSDSFDSVTFRYFSLTPSTLDEADDETGMKATELAAQAMAEASQGNEEAYLEQAASYAASESYDADSVTLREDTTYASCAEVYRDWLKDEARQEGDTTYVDNGDGGYVVLYFVRHEDHNFQMPNVRHILISVSDTTDTEAMAAAQEQAQSVLDEYLAGEQTEEAFAALAKTYSADNADEGGLYENITPGSMVETFDAWCYDESRQVGDTGIVETAYGYHVMYFCGYGDSYLDYEVETQMRNADYTAWSTAVTADLTYTVNSSAKRYIVTL